MHRAIWLEFGDVKFNVFGTELQINVVQADQSYSTNDQRFNLHSVYKGGFEG